LTAEGCGVAEIRKDRAPYCGGRPDLTPWQDPDHMGKAGPSLDLLRFQWRRDGDSNPGYAFGVYTISNRAPSASSDISPRSNALLMFGSSYVVYINSARLHKKHMGHSKEQRAKKPGGFSRRRAGAVRCWPGRADKSRVRERGNRNKHKGSPAPREPGCGGVPMVCFPRHHCAVGATS
jgi:hypothetical protein